MFSILRPFLFNLDPEIAHDLAIKSLKFNYLPSKMFAVENEQMLKEVIGRFSNASIRTSLFIDTSEKGIYAAALSGTNQIELYTEDYAVKHKVIGEDAAIPYARAATLAHELGLGINAGHDLDLSNLKDFANNVPYLDEVSIGHALISDSLYFGLSNTVAKYLACLE